MRTTSKGKNPKKTSEERKETRNRMISDKQIERDVLCCCCFVGAAIHVLFCDIVDAQDRLGLN